MQGSRIRLQGQAAVIALTIQIFLVGSLSAQAQDNGAPLEAAARSLAYQQANSASGAYVPNSRAVSLYNLGLTAYKQGSPESAIIFFKRACDIDPNLVDAQYNLGVIYQVQKRFKEAIPRFEEVLRIKPTDPDAHFQLGVILQDTGRPQDALQHLSAIAPNNMHFAEAQRRTAIINGTPAAQLQPPVDSTPQLSQQQFPSTQSFQQQQPVQQQAPQEAQFQQQPGQQFSQQQPLQQPYQQQPYQQQPGQYQQQAPQQFSQQQQLQSQPVQQAPYQSQVNPSSGVGASVVTATGGQPVQGAESSQPAKQNIAQSATAYVPATSAALPVPGSASGLVSVMPDVNMRVVAIGFSAPSGLAFDHAGNLYVANYMTNSIDRVALDGTKRVFCSGANLRGPIGLAMDEANNLYVANYNGGTVIRINPAGISSVVASGFRKPYYLTLDKDSNLYVSQQEDNSVVRIGLPHVVSHKVR